MFATAEIRKHFVATTTDVPAAHLTPEMSTETFENEKDEVWRERFELAQYHLDHDH